jgi:hypothetical protein
MPVVTLDYFLDDGQSRARSTAEFVPLMQPFEYAEDRFVVALWNAYAVVTNIENGRRGDMPA